MCCWIVLKSPTVSSLILWIGIKSVACCSDSSVWEGRDDFDDCEAKDSGRGGEVQEDEEEPPSFSRVDLSASPSDISREFPGFPGLAASVACTLEKGAPLPPSAFQNWYLIDPNISVKRETISPSNATLPII